jgi:hypothetical protein
MAGSRNERTCDGCTACCFTHAVVALQKPSGEWCVNCDVGAGCHIYADRPRACADFACLWIKEGLGDAHDRPDVLRVVVSAISVNVAGRHIRIVQFIETEPGAIDTVRVSAIIDNYKAGRAAVCIARLNHSGGYSDAEYQIPAGLLPREEFDAFRLELGKLDPRVC